MGQGYSSTPGDLRDMLRNPRGKALVSDIICRQLKFEEVCKSEALTSQLAALGATTPSFVYAKQVSKLEAVYGRVSMHAKNPGSSRIAEAFTDRELDDLITDAYRFQARDMPVFDRAGRRYDFEFSYYDNGNSTCGFYRLTGKGLEGQRFVAENNVARDVVELGKKMAMELFMFRSATLLSEGKGFHDHPDGALGMLILFSESDIDKDKENCKYRNAFCGGNRMTIN